MKFKNIVSGVVLEPTSQEVIEQLKKNSDYELVTEKKAKPSKEDKEEE